MISFMNDYSEGAHQRVLELLMQSNLEQNIGYGEDVHSDRAKGYITKQLNREDADIHFIPGGTQTNSLVISAFLRPHQCVIAADTGHINVHEAGAIEATGHKVVTMPAVHGKLTPAAIRKALEYHSNEHMVQPKMVYLSNTTELGTVYTKEELTAIRKLCQETGLLLFLDGARLASALTCRGNNLELTDYANLTDVFSIGGTKNGALLGEALVICKEELKADFRYLIKQRGAMMAKGFVVGIQFEALFQDNLYYELGSHANAMAEKMASALRENGYEFYAPPCSNQLFPILSKYVLDKMGDRFIYSVQAKLGEDQCAIRLVTSWATPEKNVEEFLQFIKRMD